MEAHIGRTLSTRNETACAETSVDQIPTSDKTSLRGSLTVTGCASVAGVLYACNRLTSSEEPLHIISDLFKGLEYLNHSRDENEISIVGEVDTPSDKAVIDDSPHFFDELSNCDENGDNHV